jgi:hypothetical protein
MIGLLPQVGFNILKKGFVQNQSQEQHGGYKRVIS